MTPRLQTSHLILRPYKASDRGAFVTLNCDPNVREHMDGALTVAQAESLFDRILANQRDWCWCVESAGQTIGHCWLEFSDTECEIGFMLAKSHWNRGFGSELVGGMLPALSAAHPALRVIATVNTNHTASIRVLQKSGFTLLETRTDEAGPYLVFAANATKHEDV